MSTTVTYKGSTLTTVNNNTKTLKTAGKYMEGDVVLTDVSIDAVDGNNIEYGLTDGTIPKVGIAKVGSAHVWGDGLSMMIFGSGQIGTGRVV